jgi:hypothetical protein
MKFFPDMIADAVSRNEKSPAILFGAGVVGMIGTTVLASRATLKLEGVIQKAQNDLKIADQLEGHEDYSAQDKKRDTAIIYSRSVMSVAKLYGPSVILGAVSIGCLTSSHVILQHRIAGLAAAYAALEHGFNLYRERVVEKYGEEQDRDFRYGVEKVKIEDPETGKTKTVTRVAADGASIYARWFDESSASWETWPEHNHAFLMSQQSYANDRLRTRGHVFLNEVYDSLGIPRSDAGAVVGWVLDGEASDNYIDFGIFDDRQAVRDFVNGREQNLLLDFNVDGYIHGKIEDMNRKKGIS